MNKTEVNPYFLAWYGAWLAYSKQISPGGSWIILICCVILLLVDGLVKAFKRRKASIVPAAGTGQWLAMILFMVLLILVIPEWIPSLAFLFLVWLLKIPYLHKKVASRIFSMFPALERTAWICLGAGLLYWIYWHLEPFIQHVNFPAHGAVWMARFFGYESYLTADAIALVRTGETTFWGTSPRHAYLFPMVSSFLLFCFMLIDQKSTAWRKALAGLFVTGFHLIYREGLIFGSLLYQVKWGDGSVHWGGSGDSYTNIIYQGLALYPLFILCSLAAERCHAPAEEVYIEQNSVNRFGMIFKWLPIVLVALGVFFLLWTPPGKPKLGRIAVDGAHSNWEWTDTPMNKELFGTKTTYNFVSMIRLLDQVFTSADNVMEDDLNGEVLNRYDVWILKTPTKPYCDEEIDALVRYVEEGGSLYLIGEHTDIFGINTNLNRVSKHFGIRFVNDSVVEDIPRRMHLRHAWERPAAGYHPIVKNVPAFLFATSCSIDADPFRCRSVMTGTGFYSDKPDYSKITFFGDMKIDSTEPYGRFHQCVAAEYGKGRIAAFSDSTTFSSFSMQIRGKPELAIGTVNWLNHRSFFYGTLRVLVLIFLGAGIFTLIFFRFKEGVFTGSFLLALFLGASLGISGTRAAEKIWIESSPEPTWTLPRAAFLSSSNYALPYRHQVHHEELSDKVFTTFYTWFQRAEVIPFMVETFESAKDYEMLVLLDYDEIPNESELEFLGHYLEGGGCLWVISSHRPLLEKLFSLLGPDSGRSIIEREWKENERVRAFNELRKHWVEIPAPEIALKGFEPGLTTEEGFVLQGHTAVGSGKLILTSVPKIFSNKEMGVPTDIPTEQRYTLFQIQWDAIDYALKGRIKARRSKESDSM